MVDDLVQYYTKFVLPMSQTAWPFSFDNYVAPLDLFKKYAEAILKVCARFLFYFFHCLIAGCRWEVGASFDKMGG